MTRDSSYLGRLAAVALAALALAPGIAAAHGGRSHEQPAASAEKGVAQPATPARSLDLPGPSPSLSLSPPCPGKSGNGCCCGAVRVCHGGGTTLHAAAAGWMIPAPRVVRAATVFSPAPPGYAPPLSAAPRGPPLVS
jgi:hypothetical protein